MATAARTGVGGSSWGSVLRSDTSGAAHDLSKAVRRGGSRVARYKAAERVSTGRSSCNNNNNSN